MTYEQLNKIAIKIVNLMAENKVSISEVDYILKSAKHIAEMETKVKKIER